MARKDQNMAKILGKLCFFLTQLYDIPLDSDFYADYENEKNDKF